MGCGNSTLLLPGRNVTPAVGSKHELTFAMLSKADDVCTM